MNSYRCRICGGQLEALEISGYRLEDSTHSECSKRFLDLIKADWLNNQRPRCPKCQKLMKFAARDPDDEFGARLIFECESCEKAVSALPGWKK